MAEMSADPKQCEAFLAVAETGSFDQASISLCITASAVSLRVQALEKALGQLLLIRGRPCVLTEAGQHLLEYLQHCRRLEQNLLHQLTGQSETHFFKAVIGSNADSLATWLLPSLKDVLIREKILLEIRVDDQAHTYTLLEKATVHACISIESKAMKGCQAIYLGKMRYYLVATCQFQNRYFTQGCSRETLVKAPAIVFNHKDQLHFDWLEQRFGLIKGSYPYHLIPSSESFVTAIKLGLGYGIVPEFQLGTNENSLELLTQESIDIALYWHHWNQQSEPLKQLTEYMVHQAQRILS